MKGCHSNQHSSTAGYCASRGAQMRVRGSVNEGDQQGCSANWWAQLTMEEVTVDRNLQSDRVPNS